MHYNPQVMQMKIQREAIVYVNKYMLLMLFLEESRVLSKQSFAYNFKALTMENI